MIGWIKNAISNLYDIVLLLLYYLSILVLLNVSVMRIYFIPVLHRLLPDWLILSIYYHIIIQELEDYIKLKLKEEEEEKEIIALKNMHKHKFYKSLHEEVIQIAWHPDRYWNWCLTEDEKKEIQKLWYR